MTDVKKTAYLAEAQTALDDGALGAAADNEWSTLSAEFDNSTNGYMFMDIEVTLASAAFTGADSAFEVYVVPSLDGANYPNTVFDASTITDQQENNQYFVGSITTSGATEAQRQVIRGVEMPNGKFKIGARNRTGDALATTGNTVKWRPWGYKSA